MRNQKEPKKDFKRFVMKEDQAENSKSEHFTISTPDFADSDKRVKR